MMSKPTLHHLKPRRLSAPGAPHFDPDLPVDDQAAAWSDLLRHQDSAELRQEFERWYRLSPQQAAAFDRIDATHVLARAARHSRPMAALEQETLARVAQRRARKRRWQASALAASLVAAIGIGLLMPDNIHQQWGEWRDRAYYALLGDPLYRTAIGEQRHFELEDGSILTLNTDSRAAVQYRAGTRHIVLRQGQALFEVARDELRPFVVTAGEHRLTALGTAFDVRLAERRFEVVLIEGRLAIEQENPDTARDTLSETRSPADLSSDDTLRTPRPGAHILSAGEQFVATIAAPPVIGPADVDRATSWRDGQLIFRKDRLDEVVNEINRYSKRKVILADASLGDLRISGIVNIGNTAVFVETLTSYYPLMIVEADSQRVILGPRRG